MDNKTPEQRHINMSRIHGKETQPEILVRRDLFKRGLRFRKNVKTLPGTPDIVLPKYRTVIFIHGCFWHGHEGCKYAVIPKTNSSFWEEKIKRNCRRDEESSQVLKLLGWKVLTIWTCELKKKADSARVLDYIYHSVIEKSLK